MRCFFVAAALDIQFQMQFGQGSGTTFGFAASNPSKHLGNVMLYMIYLANLAMTPLPNVYSWSFAYGA